MSFLNQDEASAVETVVRTAVVSILKVFCEVNEKRCHCYEEKLAEAERENTALRLQLKAAEHELQTLRQTPSSDYKISAEVTLSHDFSTDVQERRREPASLQGVSGDRDEVLVMKEEENFYESKLFMKSEMTEECSALDLEHTGIENVQVQTYGTHKNNNNSQEEQFQLNQRSERRRLTRYENVRRYRERIRADPVKYLAWKEKNHLRYMQNRKTINELPEPMKKLQRKAWREATRRHRTKKLAQAALSATSVSQTPSL